MKYTHPHKSRLSSSEITRNGQTEGRTDRRADGRTDRRTERRTHTSNHKDAQSHSKTRIVEFIQLTKLAFEKRTFHLTNWANKKSQIRERLQDQ